MPNKGVSYEDSIKDLEEKIKSYEDYKEIENKIEKLIKKTSEKVETIKKAEKWGDVKKFLDKNTGYLVDLHDKISLLNGEIEDNCERLQQSYDNLEYIAKININFYLTEKDEETRQTASDITFKCAELMKKYQELHLYYKYEILPRTNNALEKINKIWDLMSWKSNLIQSLRLNRLTWVLIFFTIFITILTGLSFYFTFIDC